MPQPPGPVIFFDGICNLCNAAVRFILKWDKKGRFFYSSLQSEYARNMLKTSLESVKNVDSIIFLEKNKTYIKSLAVIRILQELGGIWRIAVLFRIFPTNLLDYFYDLIARKRYRWFGKKQTCTMEDKRYPERFLK